VLNKYFHAYYAAILIGRITGHAHLSVCLTRKQKKKRIKIGVDVSQGRSSPCAIFRYKSLKVRVRIMIVMCSAYSLADCRMLRRYWADIFTCYSVYLCSRNAS